MIPTPSENDLVCLHLMLTSNYENLREHDKIHVKLVTYLARSLKAIAEHTQEFKEIWVTAPENVKAAIQLADSIKLEET